MAKRAHVATSKIGVNKHALTALALEAPVATCRVFQAETAAACKRLGLAASAPFDTPLRGSGNWPNIHDVISWLNAVDGSPLYAEDRKFLARLHATLARRTGK